MTKLTDTQLVILSSAAKRQDRGVILPERLKGQAARNTLERLISRGLVEEVRATGELPVWRHDDQGRWGLRITRYCWRIRRTGLGGPRTLALAA